MTVVLVGAEKGGVGKSTNAANLAVERVRNTGRDLLLVDTDKMGSIQQWAAARAELAELPRISCVGVRGAATAQQIRALAEKYDDIVIDAGGQDSPELRAAMIVADVIVTPCAPGQFDIFSAFTMDRLVGQARLVNEKLRAIMLPNLCPTNTETELLDMIQALAELEHYGLSSVNLYNRKAYRMCARDGRGMSELGKDADTKSLAEVQALAELVWGCP